MKRSAEYIKAVEALKAVESMADDVFKEVVGSKRKTGYMKWNGVKESDENALEHLARFGASTAYPFEWTAGAFEWTAGAQVLKRVKDDEIQVIVTQPYRLSLRDLEEIVAYCKENDLNAYITVSLSWYDPGSTMLIELFRG